MRQPVLLTSNTGQEWNYVGERVRADGWYGSVDGLHTVSIHYQDFIGRIKIQGTLSLNPDDNDWFDITLRGYTCSCDGAFIEFPLNDDPESGVAAFTFCGNFTFLRFVQDRSYISTDSLQIPDLKLTHGAIDKVLLSL
tara:strand:- start:1839 stop:2252 length:414 start_codon:yes stop_codon:yes gene_type:complete